MAHELEIKDGQAQMFYVGQRPWHGLGRAFTEAPSIDEAIVAAGLDWEVRTKALFTSDNEPVDRLAKATYRVSDGRILGVVGPKFQPLQNRHAFDWFAPFVESKMVQLESAGSLREGSRIWVTARINRDPSVIVPGDEVEKFILLANSHDGSLAIRVGYTPIRTVCSNTLSGAINSRDSQLIKVRHTAGLELTLDLVRDIMNVADAQFEATADQFRLLASKQISELDLRRYVKKVLQRKKSVLDRARQQEQQEENPLEIEGREQMAPEIISLFETGRGNDMPGVRGTLWAAYNAVTDYTSHHRGRNAENRYDSLWFGDSARLNRRALDVAIDMATGVDLVAA